MKITLIFFVFCFFLFHAPAQAEPFSPDDTIKTADTYLTVIKTKSKFDIEEAKKRVVEIELVYNDHRNSLSQRSRASLILSGILGKIGQQLLLNGGAEYGRRSMSAVKEAMNLADQIQTDGQPNSDYEKACRVYAKAIAKMSGYWWPKSEIIQKNLDINLKEEAKFAIAALEKSHQTNFAAYAVLQDYLK